MLLSVMGPRTFCYTSTRGATWEALWDSIMMSKKLEMAHSGLLTSFACPQRSSYAISGSSLATSWILDAGGHVVKTTPFSVLALKHTGGDAFHLGLGEVHRDEVSYRLLRPNTGPRGGEGGKSQVIVLDLESPHQRFPFSDVPSILISFEYVGP